MIVVINNRGDRLCKDGRWRDFALFGTYRYCVKNYTSVRRARAALARRGFHPGSGGRVCQTPPGIALQSGGGCIEQRLAGEGLVTCHHTKIADYVVVTI